MVIHHLEITKECPLILASASPRRKQLLKQVRIPFRSVESQVKEDFVRGEAEHLSCVLAERKALEVYGRRGHSWTLGADTMVVLAQHILGKPKDADDARAMLRLLRGRAHLVVTGFALIDPSGRVVHSEAVTTSVQIKALTDREIDAYILTHEPYGKAGSYAIQGIGAFLVEGISGSYTNVVGLPLCAVIKALVSAGAMTGFPMTTHPLNQSKARPCPP